LNLSQFWRAAGEDFEPQVVFTPKASSGLEEVFVVYILVSFWENRFPFFSTSQCYFTDAFLPRFDAKIGQSKFARALCFFREIAGLPLHFRDNVGSAMEGQKIYHRKNSAKFDQWIFPGPH
jgi:hypothetical protein